MTRPLGGNPLSPLLTVLAVPASASGPGCTAGSVRRAEKPEQGWTAVLPLAAARSPEHRHRGASADPPVMLTRMRCHGGSPGGSNVGSVSNVQAADVDERGQVLTGPAPAPHAGYP
jgi:hypothetical protein